MSPAWGCPPPAAEPPGNIHALVVGGLLVITGVLLVVDLFLMGRALWGGR